MKLSEVGDVVLRIETGRSPQTLERPASDNEPGILKVSAVSWGRFDPTAAKAVAGHVELLEAHTVRCGDLLISRANTLELVGAVAIAEASYSNRFLSDKILRLVLNLEIVDSAYLLYAMRSDQSRRHLQRSASGTSDSMRNVSQSAILKTPIPLPSLADQRRIAGSIRKKLDACEQVRRALAVQMTEVGALPQRILAAAFGEAD
jgi:type I restriction enzyme S subunit